MKTRAITGFFFVIVMLASVLFGAYTYTIFFLALSIFCLAEFYSLVTSENIKPQFGPGLVLGLAVYSTAGFHFISGSKWSYILISVPLTVLIFINELYRKRAAPFYNISFTLLGVVLAVLPFIFFYALAFVQYEYNFHFPLGFLLMLWASDTGAYLFGIKWGKTRLFERHSPKKSWEGFAGGLFTSLLVSFILSLFYTEIQAVHWAVISLLIVIFGTFGDLTESMLKRSLNVKDSGSFLPGHGGLLDRFDGLLLAAPVVFVYLYFVVS